MTGLRALKPSDVGRAFLVWIAERWLENTIVHLHAGSAASMKTREALFIVMPKCNDDSLLRPG